MKLLDIFLKKTAKGRRKFLILFVLYAVFQFSLLAVLGHSMQMAVNNISDYRYVLLFFIAMIGSLIIERQIIIHTSIFVEDYVHQQRLRIIEKLSQVELFFFEKLNREEIYDSIAIDTNEISESSLNVAQLISALTFTFIVLLYLLSVSMISFLSVLGVMLAMGLIFRFNYARMSHSLSIAKENEQRFFSSIRQMVYGIKELKLHHAKNQEFFAVEILNQAQLVHANKNHAGRALTINVGIFDSVHTLLLLTIVFIIPLFPSFDSVIIKSLAGILMLPADYLLEQISLMTEPQLALKRLERIEAELEKIPSFSQKIVEGPAALSFSTFEMNQISFSYQESQDHPFNVGPLSLNIKAGELVFIVGGNGSGKTTLLKLITGLYAPESGKILLNGQEVAMSEYRGLFTVIFSDFHLFDRLYGLENVPEEKVYELLKTMKIEHKTQFEKGAFTELNLSTGQRKRIAMIVALLEPSPIYIFDEWAADQDLEFRDFFYKHLLKSFKDQGKTVIAVTHDYRYFPLADHVIKMELGKLV
ncbi:ATP-binding cassette domain-containing protein [Deltaproteobacteria bacterium TL4]